MFLRYGQLKIGFGGPKSVRGFRETGPWAYIFVQRAFFPGLFSGELIFGGAYYWNEFCVSKLVGLDNKNGLKHYENKLKRLKTASTNRPSAYIREGLLSIFASQIWGGGLIFGKAYFFGGGGLLWEFYGIFLIVLQEH